MAGDVCGEAHPEHPEVTCWRAGTRHFGDHFGDGYRWPNARPLARPQPSGSKAPHPGPALAGFFDKDAEWKRETIETVTQWLRSHGDPFTTAQHLWPLLDSPHDKRSMSEVIRYLLTHQRIREVGTVRLGSGFTTRDGQRFAQNKKVPVYQSLICERR